MLVSKDKAIKISSQGEKSVWKLQIRDENDNEGVPWTCVCLHNPEASLPHPGFLKLIQT